MSAKTGIEWTDRTWNPVTGCTKVSPGCAHCYAERITERFHGAGTFGIIQLHMDRLEQPLHWRARQRVFVNSMSDLFHEEIPDEFIGEVFQVMAKMALHTFQVLTKRPERMQTWITNYWLNHGHPAKCLHNVWLGVSVENQRFADERIPVLLETPAAVRFISAEPLLGAVGGWCHELDWVICGGESGPGARPMDPDWARSLRDQCNAAGVPFFFKQWGGTNKKSTGRELDGREWNEFPNEEKAASGPPQAP